MIQRFQIEDLVVQDTSGVVFRALDTETNLHVALRRFFPFGPTGGGLSESEQATYAQALEQLSQISHPALRSIICGGCDPVDGMPFIVTEWIEGHALQTLLKNRPLSQPEALTLLSQGLEICQILSETLGQEGVWVETDSHTIIVGDEGTGRPVSFWISPMKWLGKNDGQYGLEPFISLTTQVMGWTGKQPRELPATGLGGWLKWLQGAARTASLLEARGMLASAMGVAAPQPTKRVVRQATRPAVTAKKKAKSKAPAWILGCTALLAIGGGGWWMVRKNAALHAEPEASRMPAVEIITAEKPSSPDRPATRTKKEKSASDESPPASAQTEKPVADAPPAAPEPTGESPTERANRRLAELTAAAKKNTAAAEAKTSAIKETIAAKGGVFSPTDHELLVAKNKEEVTVEGMVDSTAKSKSGATTYLIFAGNSDTADFRGAISKEDAVGELSESSLGALSGKKIRLKGTIRLEPVGSAKRPVIDIKKRSEIESAE